MVQAWADPIGVARQTNATVSAAHHYYIEFRVAVDGVYGHSYVAYGRLNARGQHATATYADIHPTGDIPSMVLGHFIPMNAHAPISRPSVRSLSYSLPDDLCGLAGSPVSARCRNRPYLLHGRGAKRSPSDQPSEVRSET